MDYIRAVDEYLHGPEFRYIERPPQPDVGRAPLDYFLNDSHEGYCQHFAGAMALLLRMGGIPARVATGFTPGGYSTRKQGLDRARHRRARVGRGLVRRVRLGHARPHAGRDPGPLAGRRARRAAVQRPVAPDSGTRGDTGDDGVGRPAAAVRPELLAGADDASDRRRRRRRRAGVAALGGRRAARRSRCAARACCCSSAARAARRRWTARSPRSRTRCAASGGP